MITAQITTVKNNSHNFLTLLNTVSRPGGSAAHQSNLAPGQWGSGYMTPQGDLATAPSKQFHGEDDFGDFSQGPSVSDQGDFSDFQGVQPSTQFGGLYW